MKLKGNEKTASIFSNGKNQAIRLPKQFEFEGIDKVVIRKEGGALVITPLRKNWISFAASPKADDAFMSDRTELLESHRVNF